MTDDTNVPKWLEPTEHTNGGRPMFTMGPSLHHAMRMGEVMDLPTWLAWRERVAAALGLVEPTKLTMAGVATRMIAADRVNEAIAAELRRLADSFEAQSDGSRGYCRVLRARADELAGK